MKEVESEIRKKLDFFENEFNSGQIEKLVNGFFTSNCIITGAEVPLLIGRAAAIAVFNQLRSTQESVSFTIVELREGSGDMHLCLVQTIGKTTKGEELPLKSLVTFRDTLEGLLCEADFFTPGRYDTGA